MGSCRRLSLNSCSSAILAHEPALIGVETCSDDLDQYSRCRCTTDHAKPRPRILLLLLNAAHHHGCLYTSGCCRLALVLLFFALLFQAAAPSPDPFASRYPGWDRIPIKDSANNIVTYYYYPVIEADALQSLYNYSSFHKWIIWDFSSNFPCMTEVWPGILCDWFMFQDEFNPYNNNQSTYFHIISLDLSSRGIQGPLPTAIVNLSNLIYLNLHGNDFDGNIPSIYGNLNVLAQLDLSDNNLTGPIPPEFGNFSGLQSLYLYGNQLYGTIPTSSNTNQGVGIDNLTSLVTLELQGNHLSGELPDLRGAPYLREVNFSTNNMSGSINIDLVFDSTSPLFELGILDLSSNNFSNISNFSSFSASFQKLSLNNNSISGSLDLRSINLSCAYEVDLTGNNITNVGYNDNIVFSNVSVKLENNPYCELLTKTEMSAPNTTYVKYFCNDIYMPTKRNNHNILIISISIGSMVIFSIAMAFICFCWYRKARRLDRKLLQQKVCQIEEEFAKKDVQPRMYAYKDLQKATNNFHENMKLGQGAFGAVYKGVLPDGSEIAVKLLFPKTQQETKEFSNEVALVTSMSHKNLVKLKGCCFGDNDQRILVYEFVENNNLAEVIFDSKGGHNMDWPTRKNICIGIANGLKYLHQDVQPPIVHRDIKPANILLDKNLNAKIADFGLARLFPKIGSLVETLNIVGTLGYLAPEYTRGQFSEKIDVYSLGVVLLEIVSGRSSIERALTGKDQFSLVDWAWRLHNEDKLLDLMDPSLNGSYVQVEILRTINVGLLCVQVTPSRRPSMDKVVAMLNGNMEIEIVIKQSRYQSANYDPFLTNDESLSVHLSITGEKSNMDEEPLMGFGDMKTKPNDVSSYSYGNTSKASQMSSMTGLIELSGAKPR